MRKSVRRKSYQYPFPSTQTELRVYLGQTIKVKWKKYEVCEELVERGLQMGCWGCAFNNADKREEFVIHPCKCSIQGVQLPITVYNKKEKELFHTCHDLYCACSGAQSFIYKLKS